MSESVSDVLHYDGLDFWGPYDDPRMQRLLALLRLRAGARFLDIGCGKAELLVRAAEREGVSVTGIDRSPFALQQARDAIAQRAPDANAEFLELDADAYRAEPGSFDAIAWIGGPYIGGDFATTLRTLVSWVRPGGSLLIGQGFWMQPPPSEYLEATGIGVDEFTDHAGVVDLALSHGLREMYSCVSSRDEWDHFEGTLRFNSERYALEHPDDPDPRGRLEPGRGFYRAQHRWGRDTMGFGLSVYVRPPEN